MLPFDVEDLGMEAVRDPLRHGNTGASQVDGGGNDADNAASWTSFLQKHARVLSGELDELFLDFVMDLRAQIHSTHLERELQSSQILQILQQKDAQIEALKRQLRSMHIVLAKRDVEVQTSPITAAAVVATTNAHTQCRDDQEKPAHHQQIAVMTTQLDEQHEQIEVLLDELELLQSQLNAGRHALLVNGPPTQKRATSTEAESEALSSQVEDGLERQYGTDVDSSDARAGLSCLEIWLRMVEIQNQDLQMRRNLLLHDGRKNKSARDDIQGSEQLAADSVCEDFKKLPTRFVDQVSSALHPNHLVEEHDNRGSRSLVVAKEFISSVPRLTQLGESLDPIEADTTCPNIAADFPSMVLCKDQGLFLAVVQENGKVNPFTQHQFRYSSQFGPSSEESAFPAHPGSQKSAQSSLSQIASGSAAAIFHDQKLMEEKERHQSACEQRLEEYVEKIAALTSRNAKLSVKLKDAKQKLQTFSDDNRELLRKLKRRTTAKKDRMTENAVQPSVQPSVAPSDGEHDVGKCAAAAVASLQDEVEALSSQLASREQENLALLQSLSEIKEQHSESQRAFQEMENRLSQGKEEYCEQLHENETEHINNLNNYMNQVNERLQKLESDNARLVEEKARLEAKLSATEDAEKKRQEDRSHVATISEKSTETTSEEESTRIAELLEKNQELITRGHELETQLAEENTRHEELVEETRTSNQQQRQRQQERELKALREYEKKVQELEDFKILLLEEFNDFKSSNDEAARESEKRIVFLTACVEECSRLVDSPRNEKFTTRDAYETIAALSKNLAIEAAPSKQWTKSAKSSAVRRASSVTPSQNLAPRTQPGVSQASKQTSRPKNPRRQQTNSQELADIFDDEAPMWSIRAAKLQQQLRTALLNNSNFEDTTRRLELQIDDLRSELKDRMSKELALTTKNGLLKAEVIGFKTNLATLSSQYNQVCDELQLQIDELRVNGDETARLRSALQRKSELLTQSRTKIAQLAEDLQKVTLKADFLAGGEKKAAQYLQKAKEQMQMFQNMRRQVEASQANEYQLARENEAEKERNASFQTRIKALRAENADLRLKLGDLKKNLNGQNDGAKTVQATTLDDRRSVKASANATANRDLQDEVKALRRRVLQKQQLIIAQKSKLAELEAEIAHLRTKLFDTSQINRQMQVDQTNQKESALRHVVAIREDMEIIIAETVAQLDGLRASIYDSLEVFVHCGSTRRVGREGFLRDCSLQLNHERSKNQVQLSEDALFSMRKWTDLSVNDLDALHLQHSVKQRRTVSTKEEGQQILLRVERALEQTPEDCRAEICRALEFLISRERDLYDSGEIAPSY